jgi:hypothetical protein
MRTQRSNAPANGQQAPPPDTTHTCPAAAPVIEPRAVYTLAQARTLLDLARSCLPREIRLGRLRAAKRGGRVMILGQWLVDWIEAAGQVRRRRPAEDMAAQHDGPE